VLDAEDIADPDLFHTVAGAIEGAGYDYVQGRLDMANEDDGWLNTLFRGEYGFWYNIHLPAYYHAGYPIPLGGTTNFCRRSVLSEISEIRKDRFGRRWEPEDNDWLSGLGLTTEPIPWDPLNVTEDFELGFLLWLEDYDLALIDIDTCEESPTQVNDWIRQRTRWQKGKVFTMLMYLKHPPENFLARFHILFQSALPHLGPINVFGITIISLFAVSINFRFDPLLFGLLMLGLLLTIQYMIWQAIGYWIASDKPMRIRLLMAVVNAVTLPAYWILQWGADIRALWQVYRKDLEWEKTPHSGEHLGDGDN